MRFSNIYTFFGVFSEYPVTSKFSDSRIPITLAISSTLTLLGLAIFNALTQGRFAWSESTLRANWYPQNKSLSCQTATMEMGNSYFTQPYIARPEENSLKVNIGESRGSFRWTLQGVLQGPEGRDTGETGFYYKGGQLKCNITYISLTFNFQIQSYSYVMGAMCATPSLAKNTSDNYLSLITTFSVLDNTAPKFTVEVQNILQNQVYVLSRYYRELNFSANALPSTAFPPYTNPNNQLAAQPVPNRDIMQWSVWLDGFNYTLTQNYRDFNHTNPYMNPEPQGKLYVSPDPQPKSFDQGTVDLLNDDKSKLQIAAVGIGGIRPIPPNATLEEIQGLPAPMPLYVNLTESILAIMMDMAGKDLEGRALGTGYLCTVTSTPWKNPITILAMIIAGCSGPFGIALTVMLFIARRFDTHLSSKRENRLKHQSILTQSPLIGSESDDSRLESQMKAIRKGSNKGSW